MRKSLFAFFLSLLFLPGWLLCQKLPEQMSIDPVNHRIVTGGKDADGYYDFGTIRKVYLEFAQPNYWALLTNGYNTKTDVLANLTVDGVLYDSVGVRFKGQTSYSGVQNSQKKSFNIQTDFVHPKQDVYGYQTLNLNNSFQDNSFMREVFYLNQTKNYIPAAKANYVHLFINGADWGLYPNIQQLNKDYTKEWFFSNDGILWRADAPAGTGGGPGGGPMWGDGTAGLNNLGTDTTLYKKYYTLKASGLNDPWSYLTLVCNKLNTTPIAQLKDTLPLYMDVDKTLWFLATEIAFADDDSYVFKGKMDYYIYWDPTTHQLVPLEFDGNSALAANEINWSPLYNEAKVNYPLLNRMLQVPEWRQRYLAHMRTISRNSLDSLKAGTIIENYRLKIDSLVSSDPKKLMTYTAWQTGVNQLKTLIATRYKTIWNNAEIKQIPPVIQNVMMVHPDGSPWKNPTDQESIRINATVSITGGAVGDVYLYYSAGLYGNFIKTAMYDDGNHQDGGAGDGLYGAIIPPLPALTHVRFYIEAASNTAAKTVAYAPEGAEHDVYVYQVKASQLVNIVINELMASNISTIMDGAGEYDDWIELFNLTNQEINLGGYYLTDNDSIPDKYLIPDSVFIPANGYACFWADEDGPDGPKHTNFKLSKSGEMVALYNNALQLVDSVHFGLQQDDKSYARIPNGSGPFKIYAPTFCTFNQTSANEEISHSTYIYVYPNPTSDQLQIRKSASIQLGKSRISDILGKICWQGWIDEEIPIDISHLSPGIYYLHHPSGTLRFVKK